MAWLVRAGMSPQQALHAATASAAELLELPYVGRVAIGCAADLVVLADVALDLTRFQENLRLVIQGGRISRDFRDLGLRLHASVAELAPESGERSGETGAAWAYCA